MSLSINNSQSVPQQAFKGKFQQTEQGTPYYKTNSAMKIGGTLAGLSTISTIGGLCMDNFNVKKSKEILEVMTPNVRSKMTPAKSKAAMILASGLIAIATHLGSAAYIDHKRNEKAKEIANYTKQVGQKNAVMTRDDVAISNKGRAYYDSNTGAKYGAWLGAGAGVIAGLKSLVFKKTPNMRNTPKAFKVGSAIGCVIGIGISALGGWLLGKWSDSMANNDTRKHV